MPEQALPKKVRDVLRPFRGFLTSSEYESFIQALISDSSSIVTEEDGMFQQPRRPTNQWLATVASASAAACSKRGLAHVVALAAALAPFFILREGVLHGVTQLEPCTSRGKAQYAAPPYPALVRNLQSRCTALNPRAGNGSNQHCRGRSMYLGSHASLVAAFLLARRTAFHHAVAEAGVVFPGAASFLILYDLVYDLLDLPTVTFAIAANISSEKRICASIKPRTQPSVSYAAISLAVMPRAASEPAIPAMPGGPTVTYSLGRRGGSSPERQLRGSPRSQGSPAEHAMVFEPDIASSDASVSLQAAGLSSNASENDGFTTKFYPNESDYVRAFIEEVLGIFPLLQERAVMAMLEEFNFMAKLDGVLLCIVGLGKLLWYLQYHKSLDNSCIPGEVEVMAICTRNEDPLSRTRRLLIRAIFYRYAGLDNDARINLDEAMEVLTDPETSYLTISRTALDFMDAASNADKLDRAQNYWRECEALSLLVKGWCSGTFQCCLDDGFLIYLLGEVVSFGTRWVIAFERPGSPLTPGHSAYAPSLDSETHEQACSCYAPRFTSVSGFRVLSQTIGITNNSIGRRVVVYRLQEVGEADAANSSGM
ncbi:hypothetical protein TOPH_08329 [Tolypocladium ophioglossoides CBS 100239]|uniref:Uncharacterized protein n=1 Tax=Tolypocladium ophioglossoides (strain CBS 100239) TaxID=1163406 RepID=A0A0L0MZ42_TOLOC|nr:hypothetical protein TOPH_08329 [Tolypocladium ophioglossoides CBS 100239]